MTFTPQPKKRLHDADWLLDELTRLCDAGVELVAWPDSWQHPNIPLYLSPAEAIEYARDPDAFMASYHDITVEDLRAWREAHGQYQCQKIKRDGSRCTKHAGSHYGDHDPAEWVKNRRTWCYCTQHAAAKKVAP